MPDSAMPHSLAPLLSDWMVGHSENAPSEHSQTSIPSASSRPCFCISPGAACNAIRHGAGSIVRKTNSSLTWRTDLDCWTEDIAIVPFPSPCTFTHPDQQAGTVTERPPGRWPYSRILPASVCTTPPRRGRAVHACCAC